MFVHVKRIVTEIDGDEVVLHRGDPVPDSLDTDTFYSLLDIGAIGEDEPGAEVAPEPEPAPEPAPEPESPTAPAPLDPSPFDFDDEDEDHSSPVDPDPFNEE